jgi:prophage tail gpP-like protein
VAGREHTGWTRARVTRGIEAISGSFELTATDRWSGQDEPWTFAEEDECQLVIGDVPVITGCVDRRSLAYGPKSRDLSVSGRDATGALVDCSVVLKGQWEFFGVDLLRFVQKIAEPFGIPVTMQPGLASQPLPQKITVDPGESAHDVIERACRIAGVLPVAWGEGALMLTRAGSSRVATALVEGENVVSASSEFDASGRFARYIVLSQAQGTDEAFGLGAAAIRGEATDGGVRRSGRVLIVRAETGVAAGYAKRRAQWEAKVRAARGDAVSVQVQGWTQGDGSLWPINALVQAKLPRVGVDGELLITQVVYSIDDQAGTQTVLTLKRPDAFIPEPVVTDPGTRWKELAMPREGGG